MVRQMTSQQQRYRLRGVAISLPVDAVNIAAVTTFRAVLKVGNRTPSLSLPLTSASPRGEGAMPQARSQIIDRIKSALHAQYDAILNEPLPERWVDLIHRLNEQERRQRESRGQIESEMSRSRSH